MTGWHLLSQPLVFVVQSQPARGRDAIRRLKALVEALENSGR